MVARALVHSMVAVGLVGLVAAMQPARADNGFVWAAPAPCPEAGGFVARIDTRGVTLANGNRTLRSARCDELADAVAVVVARLATEARVRQQAEVARRSEAIPRSPAVQAAARREPGMWGGGVRTLAMSGVGTLPGIGLGGEFGVYVRRRSHFAELAAARWARSPAYLTAGAPGAVDVGLTAGVVRFGWSPPDKYIRAWLGMEIGPMTGVGVALMEPQVGAGRWTAAGGGFGVIWPMFDRVRLVGAVEFMAPLEPVRFVLRDGSEIYRPSIAVARSSLGLEIGWR